MDSPAQAQNPVAPKSNSPPQRVSSYNTPHLPLATAIAWKTDHKHGNEYQLPGDWVKQRLNKRDHVSLTPVPFKYSCAEKEL
jgi:hypothetical protein